MGSAEIPSNQSVHVVRPIFEVSQQTKELLGGFIDADYAGTESFRTYGTKRVVLDLATYAANAERYQEALSGLEAGFTRHAPIRFNGEIGIRLLPQDAPTERAFARIAMRPASAWEFNLLMNALNGNADSPSHSSDRLYFEAAKGRQEGPVKQSHYLYTDVAVSALVGARGLDPKHATNPRLNDHVAAALRAFSQAATEKLYYAKPVSLPGYDLIVDAAYARVEELSVADLPEAS